MALLGRGPPAAHRVGRGFVSLYALAYMSTSLLFVAPLLVSLPLKVSSLVGIRQAPNSLALVAGVGALLAMVGNPLFGKMSDRTASRWGMRRPWMVAGLAGGSLGILVIALAPSIPVVLAGWCIAQLCFNALLAAMVAVLPDQVPSVQRGLVSGVLGVCLPVASVCGTFLVKLFAGSLLAMFLGPCASARRTRISMTRPVLPPASAASSRRSKSRVASQERHPVLHVARVDDVVVIEHQHDLAGHGAQVVEQRGQHRFDRGRPGRVQQGQRTLADSGCRRPQRGDHIGPERCRIVVGSVEREPRRQPLVGRPARSRREPLGEQRRLAESGRCGNEHQLRRRPAVQPLAQPRAQHQATRRPRDIQLRLEQGDRH